MTRCLFRGHYNIHTHTNTNSFIVKPSLHLFCMFALDMTSVTLIENRTIYSSFMFPHRFC